MNQGQPEETTTTVLYYNPAKQNGKKLDKHSKKTKLNQGKPEMQLEIMNPTILAIGMHIWQHGRRKKDDLVTESSEALRTHTHTWRRQLSGGRLTHSQTPYRLSVTQYLIRTTLRRLRLLLPLYFTMSSLVNNLIVPGHDKDVANTNGTVIQVAARDGENGSRERGVLRPLASGGGSMCLELTVTGEETPYSFEVIEESARYLLAKTRHRPKIGVICGSGLGGLAEQLQDSDEFPYETIPNFPVSTVVGHAGRMVIGLISGIPVLCMQGRFHSYEGYPLWKCAMPVRVMKVMGVEQLVVTNAAGGLNPSYNVGDIMIIKDHINMQGFVGDSPLRGKNDERFGPRFPAMNNAYDRSLRRRAGEIALDMGLGDAVKEGVYVMLGGPTYETVAELNLLRILGVDAVGMSTVPEVVVARHCGIRVFAFSLITNKCIVEYDTEAKANHEEVIEAANRRKKDLQNLASRVIEVMAEEGHNESTSASNATKTDAAAAAAASV